MSKEEEQKINVSQSERVAAEVKCVWYLFVILG